MRRVVKFGGTSLGSGALVRKMAGKVKALRDGGDTVIVVVSAMGTTTTELVTLLNIVTGNQADPRVFDAIASFGERLSANVMAATLESLGVPARAITPDLDFWPVVGRAVASSALVAEKTNQTGYAVVDVMKTQAQWEGLLEPIVRQGVVPVICGFLAVDDAGGIITLGRGGSDISAFVVGRCSRADEVIIVTDVVGVMKGDPGKFGGQDHIARITTKELIMMARGGARVIHQDALQYKLPGQTARVIHYESESLAQGGTEIVGHVESQVFKTDERLASVTLVGDDFISTKAFGLLNKITDRLARLEISIFGVSVSDQFIGVYIPEAQADIAYRALFETAQAESRFKTVSMRKGIARLKLSSVAFVEEPGVIGRVGDLLAARGINIIEMLTIHSDITVFLESNDLEHAYEILKDLAL